jgi:hypothetical protein
MKKFNVLYDGKVMYRHLSYEDAADALLELSEVYYGNIEGNIDDVNLITMEEVNAS